MTKKKTAAKKSSTEDKTEATAKKTTKKATAKKTTKKTAAKKTTKKTAAKKTTKKKVTKKTAAKTTTKKAAKKTTKKKTTKKVVTKLEALEAAAAKEKQAVAEKTPAVSPTNTVKETAPAKKAEKPAARTERETSPKTEKRPPARSERKVEPKKEIKAAPQGLAPLPGEKISSALLALESPSVEKKQAAPAKEVKETSKPKQKEAPQKSSRKSIEEKAAAQTKETPTPQQPKPEDKADSNEMEKPLSRSARKRRNQRNNKKKRMQETPQTENNETNSTADSEVQKVQTSVIEKDNGPKKRKPTGRNMLINVVDHGEIRVAIAGKNGLEEIYIEKSGGEFVHGNIFKGIVENVEPNLQAAFVNIGAEKNGFLHVRDVIYPFGGFEDILGTPDRQPSNQKRPPINHMLHKGQEILVQVTREQVATKGPSLTTYISLPGRYLVLMPAVKKRGVSRKITNRAERDELKKALEQLNPPHDMGYIIRTAGMGKGKDELQRDLDYLTMLWEAISHHTQDIKSPVAIYQESDLVIRAIRDYFTDSIDTMIIDSEEEFNRAQEFLNMTMPEDASRSSYYSGKEPLFSRYNVESEISALFSRSVRLKSGGELIIEQTEAMVTIDVNTGKFVKGKSSHDMILKINKEAALEIAKQLRLRDMGGLVMIDFIDMEKEEDRRTIENTFRNAMQADRAKVTMLPISQLGIMEMTRQRIRQSLELSHFSVCKHCNGTGVIKNTATLETEFLRNLRYSLKEGKDCIVKMHPDTALAIANKSKAVLTELERDYRITITITPDYSLTPDKFVIK